MLEFKPKNINILGYSGHSYVIIDSILSVGDKVVAYFEQEKQLLNPYKLTYLGSEKLENFKEINQDNFVFPAVGSNLVRKKMVQTFEKLNLNQLVVKHKSAIISSSSKISKSTFIGPGAILNSLCEIGKGTIINSGAIIEHECFVGDFTHIAPGAVLAGNVNVGNETFIGANSVIRQGQKIGDNVVIGAGSVVVCNIPNNEVWFGNPAKKIR